VNADKDPREMTRDELWEWAQQRTIEATEKSIAFYREKLKDKMVYSDDLIDPEDFKDPGPAKHIRLANHER
jgi:phenylacetate-coenzyme A ligase PaaK-like adenylate-forming protein